MFHSFDRYSRVARLYPALLTLAPLICSAILIFPDLIGDLKKGVASALAASCLFYLISSFARSRGKLIEARLLEQWGGWPTTILLRHRDTLIDAHTKARYHAELNALCPGLVLPTVVDEGAAPADADAIYRSATKRLAETRRGPAFKMIEDENASYGFRRNMLGLKPIGLTIAVMAIAVTAFGWWSTVPPSITKAVLVSATENYPHLPVLLAVDVGFFLLWAAMINAKFVRQAADEYAMALFRSLDN